ncbi:MAG: TIGR02266 family protein [Deltaproteobacteria bacterium]
MVVEPSSFEGQEKRSSPRAPIELRVDYKRLNSFFADYTRNIGRGGTFIATKQPLPMGTTFDFHITLPMQAQPFHLRGEVSWVRDSGPEAGMGIRFLFDDDARRLEFEQTVEKLMVDSLGPVLSKRLLGR